MTASARQPMIAATTETYPLTPMQQGMLFHALSEPHSGVDIEQLVITLPETVDTARLRAAWERTATRHDVLRTAFRWDGDEPLQAVAEKVHVPFSEISLPDEAAFSAWLHEDRLRGFEMDAPPLMRLTLFRGGEQPSRLVWTFHHALLDGRSLPILLGEVFDDYDHDRHAPAPAAPKFRDFITWQRALDAEPGESFWKDRLAGFTAPTPLTVDKLPGCAKETAQGDAETSLSTGDTTALAAFAASAGVTMNTLVQAAWALVLSRYSREEDVCFGATRACRKGGLAGAENITGLLINTVPVRTRVEADAPLLPWLQSLRADWVAMRPHEHTPLARIHALSGIPPDTRLFHSLVVFENYDLTTHFRARGGAWARRSLKLHEQTAFPLCIAAYAGASLRLVAEYDRSQLDDDTARRLLGHLQTVLENLPRGHSTPAAIPMLTATEHLELTAPARPAPALDAPTASLHALFSAQAARTPDAVALTQNDTHLTYAELDHRSSCIAAHLAKMGVTPGSIAGLCMERTPDLVVALTGILKAGAAYLPIDLAYPPDRLAFMLSDARAPVLLTQRSLAGRLPPGHGARVVFIEDVDFASAPPSLPDVPPDALCYVLYTSGSTGQPKGCCVTHRNVARLFTATQHWFGFSADDVWTLFHSTAFDFSVWEIWGALLHGGRLVIVPFEVSRSPEQFHELLIRERVTVLNQTPGAFRQLITADAASQSSTPLSLRTIIFGGEALEMQSLRPWFERHGDVRPRLVNMYGITETTVHVTYRPLTAADVQRRSVIGEAIPDLTVFILDPQGRPVPVGVPGELHVGGAGLSRGYLNRPDLTASRFIENPLAPGGRLYRSGDLARWLPGRDIEFLGRIDQQVKIRGFRIELGEIQSVLATHPDIAEAAVLALDDTPHGRRLVAWYVASPGASPGAPALREHLARFLPDYMIPAAFVPVPKMPLTNNGKLDTRALPPPGEERPQLASKFIPPRTVAEEKIARVWRRVLKINHVGIHDNFFELGGDSILSILVVSQCRQAGIALSPRDIFQHPTIAALAALSGSQSPRIAERPLSGTVPLTPIQRWFFEHRLAQPHHWNQSFVFKLAPGITDSQLDAAFAKVFATHPAFALRFTEGTDGWSQFFPANSGDIAAEHLRLDVTSPSDAALQSSFSLDGPLLRYARNGDLLTIAIHHLIVDGVSWRVLLADLDAALRGMEPAAPTTGFHTWAHELAAATHSPALSSELPYWTRLHTTQTTPLPPDFPGAENVESSASAFTITLDESETAALLRELPARSQRVQDALLAALAHSLQAWTGNAAHLIEIEGHGREEAVLAGITGNSADLSHTVGWFTAIYPFLLKTHASPAATLAATAAALDAIPRKGFGFPLLRHLIPAPGAKPSLLFNYLGQFDSITSGLETIALADSQTGPWHSPAGARTHLIEINAIVLHGRLEVRWTYSTNLHRPETIQRAAAAFAEALRQLIRGMPARRFDLAKCDTAPLLQRFPAAADIIPLTPMQQLFLSLETARPGSGSDQWHAVITGPLDPQRLRFAWREALRRHPALRCAYHAAETPHAVVLDDLEAPWFAEDLRHLDHATRERRICDFLAQDAARPFDLAVAPLTRLALFRVAENEHRFVWTHHHLEIDGWSWSVLFRDIAAIYAGGNPPCPRPYRDFIAWLNTRDSECDSAFWREYLRGFTTPTDLPLPRSAGTGGVEVTLDTPPLTDLARSLQVTANSIVQAAWALLLAHHTRSRDVVFGAALSGRPPELEGSADIVGHFVNNVPIRAQTSAAADFASLARKLQSDGADIATHQFTPLAAIQDCSNLPWNARLFSSLLVFQNYVTGDDILRLGEARITSLAAPVRTNYPLTLVATPSGSLRLTLIAQPGTATPHSARALLSQLARLIEAVTRNPGESIASLLGLLPPPAGERAPETRHAAPATPPATATERLVAAVWREAFARDVGVNENFFDIGGHSLLMLRVHARLRERTGRDMPLVKLFQHPNIRSFAAFLDNGTAQPSAVSDARERAARARAALARRPQPPGRK